MNVRFASLLGLSLLLAAPSAVLAQDSAAEFYKNKRMTLMIGSSPGGGYDTLGRAVARHYVRHIPGNPTIIIQNMPGASSLKMTNHVYNIAPRDGSVIGVANNAMPSAPILAPKGARFDPGRISWIAGPSRDAMVVMVWHTAPARTIDDLFKKEVIVGGNARGAAPVDYPLVANEVLGTKFKVVTGYSGTEDIDLAMERGEIHGNAGLGWVSAKTRNAEWLASGKSKIIAQFGFKPHPELPDVPVFKLPDNEADRQVLDILYARQEAGRPFFGPPDIPADRLKLLRASFQAMLKDSAFLEDAKKQRLVIDPVTGEDLEALAKRLAATPPAAIERARKMLSK